ncbi:diaminopimelate decarboxylase [Candidatus Thiomargarita nelsonii]|uniref:Diaminopimelate decarboxylase n=1 Tax=Candidatus Thiomargarita nelsonii TaxID=1003181 RepID=A0A0A6PQH6_9GAMM|nr:diaminopimelate decarboxylase [Candidatus Thiomargarita nelsonii]
MIESKKPYVKPTMIKLQSGLMNKFGVSPYYARKVRTAIDGVSIDELVKRFGSPLFVFSEKQIRNTIREAKESFATRYPNVTFGWSYKTNYLDAINAIYHQEGSIAEVVSEMEYDKARRLGIPGEDIIFNGPHKSMTALKKAAEEGAKIHIDHFDEIDDLEKVAAELGKELSVAIRLNLDSGIQPQWSRFGFNLESGQAMDAVRRIQMGGKLRLNGLHCHIGTFILEPDAYKTQTEKMVRFAYELEETLGVTIEYLDIGGGFPSKNKLKGTYLPPDVSVPPLDTFAEKISEGLYNALKPGDFPKLYLETGRALIDEAGYLITTVFASKRLPDGRKSYVLDAGVNLLFTATWYKFTIETDREMQGLGEPALLNGPLCMNIDVVDDGILLPPMKRGTRLILSPVGAYNVTQWMQFIEYRPAVVLVTETGEVELIREREDLSDILRRERLPERLRLA